MDGDGEGTQGHGRARGAIADFRSGKGSAGIERLEVYCPRYGFSTHRHDTYAIGVTLGGVQAFWYRGAVRYCLPGQCHILHPDEPHDGVSGSDEGFRYRIAYLDPRLVQLALGGRALPFVEEPVLRLTRAHGRLLAAAWNMTDPLDALRETEIVAAVADVLVELEGSHSISCKSIELAPLLRVHDLLSAVPGSRHTLSELERVSGLDRWTLARQFRSAFGTSPTRFRTMRQLDMARRLIRQGVALIEVAERAGFADQCHMSRQFKNAYGMTPARWGASVGRSPPR